MKILALIIVLVITSIGVFLGYRVLGLLKIIKQLRADRNELLQACTEKNIEIGRLNTELDKYFDVEIKVALTVLEKRMILNALNMPHYQLTVQDPKTNYFIREIYRKLKEKIKGSIKNG